jgi:hypothetical protein
MKEVKQKQEYGILPHLSLSDNTIILKCNVVVKEGNSIRNCTNDRKHDGLTILCYVRPDGFGSSEIGYMGIYFADSCDCKAQSAMLSSIKRKNSNLTERLGYCERGLPEIGRLCAAAGLSFVAKESYSGGAFYTDNEYQFLSIPSGLFHIEQLVQEYMEKHHLLVESS